MYGAYIAHDEIGRVQIVYMLLFSQSISRGNTVIVMKYPQVMKSAGCVLVHPGMQNNLSGGHEALATIS